jgi:hypothetical protein
MANHANPAGSDQQSALLAEMNKLALPEAQLSPIAHETPKATQADVRPDAAARPRRWLATLLIGSCAAAGVAFHFLPLFADEIERTYGAQPWLGKLESVFISRQLRDSVKPEDLDRWTSSLQSFASLSEDERSALVSTILLSNEKLEQRISRNATQLSQLSQSVNRVSARVGEGEKTVNDIFHESGRTNQRVDELRGTFEIELTKHVNATEARTSALETDIAAIGNMTAEKIGALVASVNALEARMAASTEGDKQFKEALLTLAADIVDRQKINEGEITTLKTRNHDEQSVIAAFDDRLVETNSRLASKSASMLVMLRLLNSMSTGALNISEIDQLADLAAGDASAVQRISELKALNGAKAPPLYVLRDRLRAMQPRVVAVARFEDLSWIRQTITSTQETLSTIGMASPLEPTISEVAIEKAMLSMDRGDLATALFELEALGPKSARLLSVWINEAKLRLALNEAVEQLINRMIAQVKKT